MCKLSGLLCFRQVSGNRVAILFCLFWGIFIVHRIKMGFWESTDSISETTEIQEKHFPWQMIQNWYPSLLITGFPDSSAGKESSYNTGDSWVGKISWRRERLPTPIFWPGEFHALYSPWGHKESDATEQLCFFWSHSTPWHIAQVSTLPRGHHCGQWSWLLQGLHYLLQILYSPNLAVAE